MAEQVLAHQVISEEELTVLRTPKEYADHVKEMIEAYGDFSLEIRKVMVQDLKFMFAGNRLASILVKLMDFSLPVFQSLK
ncbi:Polyketide cyclase OS=Lysinibacillus sphaericus OX=1421 GN=LS41612_12935 PE=4 SV=1 [Lysinibacillus sphaericus]